MNGIKAITEKLDEALDNIEGDFTKIYSKELGNKKEFKERRKKYMGEYYKKNKEKFVKKCVS